MAVTTTLGSSFDRVLYIETALQADQDYDRMVSDNDTQTPADRPALVPPSTDKPVLAGETAPECSPEAPPDHDDKCECQKCTNRRLVKAVETIAEFHSGGKQARNDLEARKKQEAKVISEQTESYVRYEHVHVNRRSKTQVIFNRTGPKPMVLEDTKQNSLHVFDAVTTFTTIEKYQHRPNPAEFALSPPPSLPNGFTSVIIRSEVILKALQSMEGYYPEVSLYSGTVRFVEPYRYLVHHYDELVAYKQRLGAPGTDDLLDGFEPAEAQKHISLLLEFLDANVMEQIVAERRRHDIGVTTFDLLWLSLKPGEDVALFNVQPRSKGGLENRDGGVLATVSGGPRPSGAREPWQFDGWRLAYDGRAVTRKAFSIRVEPFDGEMDLSQLEILSMSRAKTASGAPLRPYLVEQGRKWYSLLQPLCMHHEGETLRFPFHKVSA